MRAFRIDGKTRASGAGATVAAGIAASVFLLACPIVLGTESFSQTFVARTIEVNNPHGAITAKVLPASRVSVRPSSQARPIRAGDLVVRRVAAKGACCWSRRSNHRGPRCSFSSTARDAMKRKAHPPLAQPCLDSGLLELRPAPTFLPSCLRSIGHRTLLNAAGSPRNRLRELSRVGFYPGLRRRLHPGPYFRCRFTARYPSPVSFATPVT